MRRLILLALATMACAIPATAGATTTNVTPSTLTSAISAAQPGDTLLLASGSYGNWSGTSKAITLKAADGAKPTMTLALSTGDANFTLDGLSGLAGDIDNDVHDVTIKNATTSSTIEVTGDRSGPVVFDNVHFDAHVSDCSNGCLPALWIGPGGTAHDTKILVKNSLFTHSPGDGIQAGSSFTVTDSEFNVTNNGACGPCHTDSIQLYGGQANDGTGSTILRNYIHDGGTDSDGIVQFDGGGHNDIEDNVIAREQLFGMDLGNDTGSKVIHNTIVVSNGRTGLDMTSKQKPGSQGAVLKDNVTPSIALVGGSCNCTAVPSVYSNNMGPQISGSPVFVGGTSPTTYAGFALAAGSPGKGKASDGLDVGIRVGSTPPPPPPPPPLDTDGDGVPDLSDACPTVPGTGVDGCPVTPPPPPPPSCDDACVAGLRSSLADAVALAASRLDMIHARDTTVTALQSKIDAATRDLAP